MIAEIDPQADELGNADSEGVSPDRLVRAIGLPSWSLLGPSLTRLLMARLRENPVLATSRAKTLAMQWKDCSRGNYVPIRFTAVSAISAGSFTPSS